MNGAFDTRCGFRESQTYGHLTYNAFVADATRHAQIRDYVERHRKKFVHKAFVQKWMPRLTPMVRDEAIVSAEVPTPQALNVERELLLQTLPAGVANA